MHDKHHREGEVKVAVMGVLFCYELPVELPRWLCGYHTTVGQEVTYDSRTGGLS